MSDKTKRVDELTNSQLDKAVQDIIQFYDFTFFGERGVEEPLGLCFALEYQASSFGLVGDWLYEDVEKYNSADMMQEFTKKLNERAAVASEKTKYFWENYIKPNLPY
jgi:hypothetical protein